MPPPTPPSVPWEAKFMFLFRIISSAYVRALQHNLTLYFPETQETFSVFKYQEKPEWFTATLCVLHACVCAPLFFFFSQITFSNPETEPLAGKRCHSDPSSELHLCLSHSPPVLVFFFFLPLHADLYLSPVLLPHVKVRRKTVISILNENPSYLFSCQDLFF